MSVAMPIAFSTWNALLNNFVVERAGFTGVEIGILQSLREIPGFLAFAVIFVLLIIKEQALAVVAHWFVLHHGTHVQRLSLFRSSEAVAGIAVV